MGLSASQRVSQQPAANSQPKRLLNCQHKANQCLSLVISRRQQSWQQKRPWLMLDDRRLLLPAWCLGLDNSCFMVHVSWLKGSAAQVWYKAPNGALFSLAWDRARLSLLQLHRLEISQGVSVWSRGCLRTHEKPSKIHRECRFIFRRGDVMDLEMCLAKPMPIDFDCATWI